MNICPHVNRIFGAKINNYFEKTNIFQKKLHLWAKKVIYRVGRGERNDGTLIAGREKGT